jgi:hypothetical protein
MGQAMYMGGTGEIQVTHWRGSAAYNNGLRITLPIAQVVVYVASNPPAVYGPFGPYIQGTEIRVELFNNPSSNRDNLSYKAQFQSGYQDGFEWHINWEDDTDDDFNDSYTVIEVINFSIFTPGQVMRYNPPTTSR